MSTQKIADRRVGLITGASSGIGQATAKELAQEGYHLSLAARSEGKLDELKDHLDSTYNIDSVVLPTDIRNEDEVIAMVERTIDKFGHLDVVLSNAGTGAPGTRVDDIQTQEYRTLMETNVDGTFFTVRETVPHLRKTSGNLIFMSSIAGQYPRPATPLYAATKWWIRGFALSIEGMVAEDGVGVTIVNPAEVRTGIEVLGKQMDERFDKGEISEPEEVAEAVAFAARQQGNSTITELDLYWRGKIGQF